MTNNDDQWCDDCGMVHPERGCPPTRAWWVNLVTETTEGKHIAKGGTGLLIKSLGTVKARSAWTAMQLAVEKYGHVPEGGQRITVDSSDYFRTSWDRLLDDDMQI